MIRKLQQKDREILLDCLAGRPAYSVYLASHVRRYGLEDKNLSAWADMDENGISYGFVKFYDSLQLFARGDDLDARAFMRYLREHGIGFKSFIARSALFARVEPYCIFSKVQYEYLCELSPEGFIPVQNGVQTQKAVEQDLPGITALRESIEEFEGMLVRPEVIRKYIQDGNVVIAKENGRVVSVANCSATAFNYAGIGGVCTDKAFRGRGFASRVVSDLSAMMLGRGFHCCLTYDNPDAGSIYKRMGYRQTGFVNAALK